MDHNHITSKNAHYHADQVIKPMLIMRLVVVVSLYLLLIFFNLYENSVAENVLPAVYKYRCNSGLEMDGPDTVRFVANIFVP